MLEVEIEQHKNNIVKKHNELIKAQGALSSTAYKMLCSVISMIKVDDSEFQEYALKRDEYLKMIGSTSNNDTFIYEQAEQLMKNPFKVEGKLFNWCSMVDFERIPGYIIFDIHPKLKPYLLELRNKGNITQYEIINILSLRGDYTPRLYELIISKWNTYRTYNKQSKSYTFELELDFLRDTLSIPNSYLYNNIKTQILDKAVKQFEEKTNIKIEYKEQKLGKKVVRLQITVKDNVQGSNDVLRSRQAFIAYVRKAYKPDLNKNFFPVVVSTTKGDLKVSKDGLIYNNALEAEYTREQADKLWNWLYDECIKRGDLSLLADPEQKGLF